MQRARSGRGIAPLVRLAARAGAVPRSVPGPPGRAHAARRPVVRGAPRGRACLSAVVPATEPAGARLGLLRSRRAAPPPGTADRGGRGVPAGECVRPRAAARSGPAVAGAGSSGRRRVGHPTRSGGGRPGAGPTGEAAGPLRRGRAGPGRPTRCRIAAEELATIASTWSSPYVDAVAAYATGAVLLAEGEPGPALRSIRRARTRWVELDAPHEAARARRLVGLACRALGDERSAEQELEAAHAELVRLGAATKAGEPDRAGIACRRKG